MFCIATYSVFTLMLSEIMPGVTCERGKDYIYCLQFTQFSNIPSLKREVSDGVRHTAVKNVMPYSYFFFNYC